MRRLRRIQLTIGDLTIALASHSTRTTFHVDYPLLAFTSRSSPDAAYRVVCGGTPELVDYHNVFSTGLGWSLHAQGDQRAVWTRSQYLDPYQVGIFSQDFSTGTIYVQPCELDPRLSLLPLGYPLGVIVMISLLAQGRGVMVHACAVDDGGRGFVFAGTGGSGKTTIARLWETQGSARALGDDRIIIRQQDGRFWAYGTPWPGEGGMSVPARIPIEHVFFLRQEPLNRVAGHSPASATARVLANAFPTYWDASGMAFTLDFLAALSVAVPCSDLGFVPEPSVVDFVRCLN